MDWYTSSYLHLLSTPVYSASRISNRYNGYNGYIEPRVPCLAICYENGKIQLMRDENDGGRFIQITLITCSKVTLKVSYLV